MKKLITLFLVLFSVLSFSQSEDNKEIIINKAQEDDKYLAGETIKVNAAIKGDLVGAGGKLIINDSIHGDFTGVGGDISLEGHIVDDVRLAGGRGSFKVNPESIIPMGDDILITQIKDTMKLDGDRMEIDAIVVWCIIDGKIKEAWDIPILHTARILGF